MKKWGLGTNTCRKEASIHIEIMPWYLFLLERISEWFCDHFPNIPFPSWIHYTYTNEDGSKEVYTLKEWWGGTQSWFHCCIHSPIFSFVYNEGRCKGYAFDVDYELVKKFLCETDKERWESIVEREKEEEQDKKEIEI
jgi:hypothetical protein